MQIKKNKKSIKLLNYIYKFIYHLELIIYKIRILFPILAYVLAVSIIILTFAMFYESNSTYAKENELEEGLYYNHFNQDNNRARAEDLDPLYFSTCTFLNANDGNIIPVGDPIKMLVQLEMLLAHVLNIIFIPTLLFFYFKMFESKPKTCKNKSKKCIYNDPIDQNSFSNNIKNTRRRNKRYRSYKKS